MSFSPMCGPAPDDDYRLWCDECGNDGCQCDRGYAAYLEAWTEAVERGEYDTVEMGAGAQIEMQEAA